MIAKITKINIINSKMGGKCYCVNFKDDSNKFYISYIYPRCRNFTRWKKVLDVGTVLSNLKLWKANRNIIDADSKFVVVEVKK
jgi:hypothetical protein